jgi:hypothetical protein
MEKAAEAGTAAGNEYIKKSEELMKQTQGLSKWHEGLVTSYEGIAGRYKAAFEESEKQRDLENQTSQRDYGANAALMSRAAAVGMGGQGPMTGAQQQLMMSTAQQQATNAYSTALDRSATTDMQRKTLGAQVVKGSMEQELANRNAGFSMESGVIQGQGNIATNIYGTKMQNIGGEANAAREIYGAGMTGVQNNMGIAGQIYATDLSSISDQVNANTYAGQAGMGISTAVNQFDLGTRGMREGLATSNAQLTAMQNMPQAAGPNKFASGITNVLGGAGTGAMIGGAIGGPAAPATALIGAGVGGFAGLLKSIFE